jgi:O-methyltransferase involved in polyketide biosynthesis
MPSLIAPPGADIGFGLEGHVMYTAARTKLINDQVDQWLDNTTQKYQVLNLGAGVDTRVYWLESLKKATVYWEVYTASVMNHKHKILDSLQKKGELPEELSRVWWSVERGAWISVVCCRLSSSANRQKWRSWGCIVVLYQRWS